MPELSHASMDNDDEGPQANSTGKPGGPDDVLAFAY
jgi:hypothetical protein